MNPAIIVSIIQLAVSAMPSIVSELRLLFSKGDPTDADWEALKRKVKKSYDDYIAEARAASGASNPDA